MNKLKIILKNTIKPLLIFIILLFLYTFICALNYSQAVSSNISNSVLRLHVIANSDNVEDQNLKYIVRDSLLEYMNTICSNVTSKADAIKLLNDNIDNFKSIAINTIKDNNFNYDVNISTGNFYFPTKYYGDISFPAGMYDALKVEIGEAKGKNWWCVMFPSLCFFDLTSGIIEEDSKQLLEENLSEESYLIVSNQNDSQIHFKFKILEFFGSNDFFTAKK